MNSIEFEQELKNLDKRFSVLPNPNRPGLSNIFFAGKNFDLPVISSNEIKEEVDQGYRYEFPNGMRARYWSKPEILARIEDFLKDFNKGKFDGLHDE